MSKKQYQTIQSKALQLLRTVPQKNTNILCDIIGSKMFITFNRPKRLNSFSLDMYVYFAQLIKYANELNEVKYIIIQGSNGNFSSGNDLTNFTNPLLTELGEFKQIVKAVSFILKNLCEQIIKSDKPIIAITEGKVIGFAFTKLALFDRVFAVESSQFFAPLVKTAQGPQMCSSYLFPKIFGYAQAERLITFGQTVNSEYLSKYNFLESCKNKEEAIKKMEKYIGQLDELQWNSYINARRLMKERQRKILLEVNEKEIQNLIQRWLDPNLLQNIAKHLQKTKQRAKL